MIDTERRRAEELVREMLSLIGEDPNREGLAGTPERVVRSWNELYSGYSRNPEEVLNARFAETSEYDQMILLGPVEFSSMCEHHMLPFYGTVTMGYIPGRDGKVVGVSKLARAVDVYARRLQIQERMTKQLAEAIMDATKARGVGVLVHARHTCMSSRGVREKRAVMTTSELTGLFRDSQNTRDEFLRLAQAQERQ